jgi:hypothetical protein
MACDRRLEGAVVSNNGFPKKLQTVQLINGFKSDVLNIVTLYFLYESADLNDLDVLNIPEHAA